MKTSAFLVAILASSAQAFVPANPGAQIVNPLRVSSSLDEVDYDAPPERAAAVGNLVKSENPSVFGVPVPAFIAKAFGVRLPYGDAGKDAKLMDLDDECYLGKDGNLDECADFDPPVTP